MKCETHLQTHRQVLRSNRLKATPARLEILDVFEHESKPLSVKDVVGRLGPADIDQVTVYRTAESLAELGVMRRVRLQDRSVRYELANTKHHHHVICEQCGKISDVHACLAGSLEKFVLKKLGFSRINRHALEFFGICQACEKKYK